MQSLYQKQEGDKYFIPTKNGGFVKAFDASRYGKQLYHKYEKI